MKVTVTKEHYDRAVKFNEEYANGGYWGRGCLIAQALLDIGIKQPMVMPSMAYTEAEKVMTTGRSPYYILPQNARHALNEFDRSIDDPSYKFEVELPFEFELGELYSNQD